MAERVDRRWKNFRVLGREPTNLATDKGFQPQNRGGNIGIIKQDIAIRAAALYTQVAARNRATLLALERTVGGARVGARPQVARAGLAGLHRRSGAARSGAACSMRRGAPTSPSTSSMRAVWSPARLRLRRSSARRWTRATSAPPTPTSRSRPRAPRTCRSRPAASRSATRTTSAGALRRIGRESEMYYLLGFRPTRRGPTPAPSAGSSVRVTRPGVRFARGAATTSAGRGRQRADAATASVDDELTRATDSPYDLAAMPLLASAYIFGDAAPGRALTLLAVEADLRAFAFGRGERGTLGDTLDLRVLVTEQATGATERYERDVAMTFPATDDASTPTSGATRSPSSVSRPGATRRASPCAIATAGASARVTHEFEVPPLDGLRVTTPDRHRHHRDAVARLAGAAEAGAGRAPGLSGRRDALLPVQRARRRRRGAAARGRPVTQSAAADGAVVKRMEPRPIAPNAAGRARADSPASSLAGVPAGDYELVLQVTDESTGQLDRAARAVHAARARRRR